VKASRRKMGALLVSKAALLSEWLLWTCSMYRGYTQTLLRPVKNAAMSFPLTLSEPTEDVTLKSCGERNSQKRGLC